MLLLLRVGNAILLPPVGVWLLWIVAQDIALRRSTAALAGDAVTAESRGVALHTSTPKGPLGESSPGSMPPRTPSLPRSRRPAPRSRRPALVVEAAPRQPLVCPAAR